MKLKEFFSGWKGKERIIFSIIGFYIGYSIKRNYGWKILFLSCGILIIGYLLGIKSTENKNANK